MSILLEDSPVYDCTRQLCEALITDPQVLQLKADIDAFLGNAEARALFDCVNKMGEELREKHMAGMEPSEEEISKFDQLRENVISNEVCHKFLQARQQVDGIFNEVNRYFGMTLELNRVPSHEEVIEAMNQPQGGCCGGGSCGDDCSCEDGCDKSEGGSCGCQH